MLWGFLLQTLTASVCAVFLLIIKWLLEDKLSPRWQYSVWIAFALRVLIPVRDAVIIPLPLWLETCKAYIEKTLHSSYSSVYSPITSLPSFRETILPTSVTDWLFLIYVIGVAVCLIVYLVTYFHIRLLLHKADAAPTEVQNLLRRVCETHHLRGCPVLVVRGIDSAFIFGQFRPVLVVPFNTVPDEKVLLHELLHLKHHDSIQNLFWCIVRALHWCNPLIQYVCSRIGNDMERLCDQRVLERLNGEERRNYGTILLSMANERFARAPGTSSISNGGKNISRRIEAIARFKKYPQGMSLVNACIILLLCVFMLSGNVSAVDYDLTRPSSGRELTRSMAYARLNRCSTVAGALDTYSAGLLWENGIYLAMASPLSEHQNLEAEMRMNTEDGWVSRHLETYHGLECVDGSSTYQIIGLRKVTDLEYHAWILINVYGFLDSDGFLIRNQDRVQDGFVTIPVSVSYEDAWVVQERGERVIFQQPLEEIDNWSMDLPWVKHYFASGSYGEAQVQAITRHWPRRSNLFSHNIYAGGTRIEQPDPNAEFQNVTVTYQVSYMPDEVYQSADIRCQIAALDRLKEAVSFQHLSEGSANGSDSHGRSWFRVPDRGPITFPLIREGYCFWYADDLDEPCITLPAGFAMQISHGSAVMEELLLREAADE